MRKRSSLGAKRHWLVLLTLVVMLSGLALPAAQPASAAPVMKYSIRFSFDPAGNYRGWAGCNAERGVTDGANPVVVIQIFECQVRDTRSDRYRPFVVPRYWNGSDWKVLPGFEDRWCTNRNGGGTTRTCTKIYDPLIEIPGTSSTAVLRVKIRVGLVDRFTGQVVNHKDYVDEWSTAV